MTNEGKQKYLDRIKGLAQLVNEEIMQSENPETEKRRRIYYQDIVYKICSILDSKLSGTTVCGTWAEPSTEVIDRLNKLLKEK